MNINHPMPGDQLVIMMMIYGEMECDAAMRATSVEEIAGILKRMKANFRSVNKSLMTGCKFEGVT